jgi:hypothetical protein
MDFLLNIAGISLWKDGVRFFRIQLFLIFTMEKLKVKAETMKIIPI